MPQMVKIKASAPSQAQPAAKASSGAVGDPASKPLLRVGLSSSYFTPNLIEQVVAFVLFFIEKPQTSPNPF